MNRRALKGLVSFMITSYLISFVFSRVARYRYEYARAVKEQRDDLALLRLCESPDARGGLGKNSIVCDAAELGAASWPALVALERVAVQTHLCGDSTCVDIARTFFSSWGAVAVFVGVFAASPPVLSRFIERLVRPGKGTPPAPPPEPVLIPMGPSARSGGRCGLTIREIGDGGEAIGSAPARPLPTLSWRSHAHVVGVAGEGDGAGGGAVDAYER